MHTFRDPNNPELKAGDRIGGYRVQRISKLKEINAFYYEIEHEVIGTQHIHISNADKENTFGVAFKTVPADSSGVAHILEHTVLCGSRKFPVRDPFFSMLKRSLNTFMNAFTASDWTMYPFSTQNEKDFYNLMDVYLDAAFYPNLDELSFKQEGHRLDIERDTSGNSDTKNFHLVYKGVVYNEMKGAMSSPDQVMIRTLLKALYPDTTYSNNSGGEPSVIPQLTHEQLKTFHRRHYHPSNAFFYTYGNLPVREHLKFIEDKILKHFDRIDPQTDVPNQPRWKNPRKMRQPYPLAANEAPQKKHQYCLAWLMADITDSFEILVLSLLEQILLGNAASPLRKALMDSGLGATLSDGTGFDADNKDTFFACGLKDVAKSAVPEIERIILKVLRDLTQNGIDPQMVESAIHQMEFNRKEITNTPYPYGIKLLMTISACQLHGGDSLEILLFDKNLDRLRKEIACGPFLENRIKTWFLDNPHRVCLLLYPDQEMEEKEKKRVEAELKAIQARLTPADIERIQADAATLQALQEKPEDLSVLPTLEIRDIPPEVRIVSPSDTYEDLSAQCYDQPTSGIFYFSSVIGCGTLPPHLLPWVSFFSMAFTKIGTSQRDYVDMAKRIDAHTGGIGMSSVVRTRFNENGDSLPYLTLNGKCLDRNQSCLFELLEEFMCRFAFSDLKRLKTLLLEYKAGLESSIVSNGHHYAMSLAMRNFSPACALDEIWHGVHQLQFIKTMTASLSDERLEKIATDLSEIATTLFTATNLKMALIGGRKILADARQPAASIVSNLPRASSDAFFPPPLEVDSELLKEGWTTSSAVSFVAQVFKTVRMQHPDAPCLAVISKILRALYLHREIREKGGAYGGFALYNPENGMFCFGSYRDPHIIRTLDVYQGALKFIVSGEYCKEDIKDAILQVCSQIDRPDTPGPTARKAFYRQIVGLTDEQRQRFKADLLALNRSQIMDVAHKYFNPKTNMHSIAVISSESHLTAANQGLKQNVLEIRPI
jgi:hypothetical protein